MFYTSYFSNIENIKRKNPDMVFIRVSRGCVKGYEKMWSLPSLMPSEELLSEYKNRLIDAFEYKWRYEQENLKWDIKERRSERCDKLVENLKNKFGDKDICFICYEGKDKFCHRQEIRMWLEYYKYPCKEW